MAPETNRLTEEDCLSLLMLLPHDAGLGAEFITVGAQVRPDLFLWLLAEMSLDGGHAAGHVAFRTRGAQDAATHLHFIWWRWLRSVRNAADLTNSLERHIVGT